MRIENRLVSTGHQAPDTYYDLGTYRRRVTTVSADAQLWFDRGLRWSYSFNHEEAARCFERATVYDPTCAMAFWGIAYALGPNYNKAWTRFDQGDLEGTVQRAKAALACALELAEQAYSPTERALIEALAMRFPGPDIPQNLNSLDFAYANAMRSVYQSNKNDQDVIALFAEALICTRPRALWNLDTGEPTSNCTIEARAILESAMAKEDGHEHPALFHLYIHLMEMSPFPEVALPAADRLRRIVPDGSHLLHMGTHIDIACGDYRRAMMSNHDATVADDKYFARESGSTFYTMYRAHNVYAKIYATIMLGCSKEALSAAKSLWNILTPEALSITSPPMADWAESYLGVIAHVLVRFGRWEDILSLELPADKDLFCSTTAMILYARGVALGVLGRFEEAQIAREQFEAARDAVPATRLNSLPSREIDVLRVAAAMLKGELEYRKGNHESAFSSLRKAVELEDALPYTDTPPWMQPARHALGALLLEQNRVAEAELVYREDLGFRESFPRRRARLNNVWGLHGLYECFMRSAKHSEALLIRSQRDIAMACTDISVTASCYCRLSTSLNGEACCPVPITEHG